MLRSRGRYKTYSVQTKLQVINSNNPNFYSNEGVPRTTAIYWLKNAKRLKEEDYHPNKGYELKIKLLEKQLEKEKKLKNLIIMVRKLHPYSFSKKKVASKVIKKKIIEEIKKIGNIASLKTCLYNIGLSPTTYYRWLTIFTKCEFSGKTCKKRLPHQLTFEEISKMKFFVTASKYAHIPISSLCLLAQRLGDVFCSIHTWYKYINLFEWRRFERKRNVKN
jgi:hypothetical protein